MKTPREILLSRHGDVEPKLEGMWPSVAAAAQQRSPTRATLPKLARMWGKVRSQETGPQQGPTQGKRRAPLQLLWQELILPSQRVWAGVACAWVVIAVLHVASSEPATTEVASQAKPPSRDEMRVLIEQRRMLAQLIAPLSEPAYTQKRAAPGPHSERAAQTAAV
jgi:hypothetical protein